MRKPFQFAIVGGLATFVQYVALVAGVQLCHWRSDAASAVGFSISAALNYYLNYHWTFASDINHLATSTKFFVMAGAGLLINTALMWLLSVRGNLPYLVSQVIATILVFLWSYTVSSRWVYRARENEL